MALVIAGAAWFSLAAEALTAVSVDRAGTLPVTPDDQAVLALSGFQGIRFELEDGYRITGTVNNRADVGVEVRLTVDPEVTAACRQDKDKDKDGDKSCKPADWTLSFCWSSTNSPEGKKKCPSEDLLEFSGDGPGDPAPATTEPVWVPAGGARYLLVRLDGKAKRFCASSTFRFDVSFAGGVNAVVPHSASAPRYHVYEVGSGCGG